MRTILFDLDGTLVDSAALITRHLAGALRAVGAEVPGPAQVAETGGRHRRGRRASTRPA